MRGRRHCFRVASCSSMRRRAVILLATVVAGMHCEALRKVEPSFRAVAEIKSTAPEIKETLTTLVKIAVTRKHWKKGRIKRLTVLDYRTGSGDLPKHIQDFSRLKIKTKRHPVLRSTSSIHRHCGAGHRSGQCPNSGRRHPIWRMPTVLLLNCGSNDWGGRRLRTSELAEYDPKVG